MENISLETRTNYILKNSHHHHPYHHEHDSDDNHWQSSALCLLSSVQLKNFPLNSWTPTTAKMNWNIIINHQDLISMMIFNGLPPGKGGRQVGY